jgi:hypothetical protein
MAKSSTTNPVMRATRRGDIPNTVGASIHPKAQYVHVKELAIPAT